MKRRHLENTQDIRLQEHDYEESINQMIRRSQARRRRDGLIAARERQRHRQNWRMMAGRAYSNHIGGIIDRHRGDHPSSPQFSQLMETPNTGSSYQISRDGSENLAQVLRYLRRGSDTPSESGSVAGRTAAIVGSSVLGFISGDFAGMIAGGNLAAVVYDQVYDMQVDTVVSPSSHFVLGRDDHPFIWSRNVF